MGILVAYLFWQTLQNFQFPVILNTQNITVVAILLLSLIIKTFFIAILAILFLTDLKKMFIPDRIILPSIIIGIVLNLIITISQIGYFYYLLSQTVVGRLLLPPHNQYFQRQTIVIAQPFALSLLMGLLIGGFFWSLIIITRGKGMGGGDVKLGTFIGIMLGFPQALLALVLSFLTGALFSIILLVTGKKKFGQSIAFGPFLSLGSLIVLFWGTQIINWYLHIGR